MKKLLLLSVVSLFSISTYAAIGHTVGGSQKSCRITYGGANGHTHTDYGCGSYNTDPTVTVSCSASGCTVTSANGISKGSIIYNARASKQRIQPKSTQNNNSKSKKAKSRLLQR